MAEGEKENNPIKNDSGEETDDESEVLEESPCGRWQKRREEVDQRDVPGIDNAFLAMDTEEGVEVVWNEVQFSEKKNFRAQQDKIHKVFDNLIQLDHPNIVKFHKYWTDTKGEKPRVIFITEYMSSGSLKQFLHRTKKNNKTFQLKQWKRWCTQILSALSYLHSCDPPIIHGNLTCDTIFIQHNGLIKIGSVAPEAINMHVKTYRDDLKNMHCIAPEYGDHGPMTTKVDIYAFGMCALEMAALGIQGNGDGNPITEAAIKNTLASLEDSLQREGGSWTPAPLEDFPRDIPKQDFLRLCINKNPNDRPTARELLFHAVLFEVHSLKLLAAHAFVRNNAALPENVAESAMNVKTDPNKVLAEVKHVGQEAYCWTVSKVPALELEKLLEDVRNGIYPLTAFSMVVPPPARQRALTPELAESVKSETPEPCDVETRNVVQMHCQVKQNPDSSTMQLNILLRMNDKINRQLQCDFSREESASMLADELVHYGFINQADRENIAKMVHDEITSSNYGQKVSDVVIPPIPSSS